MRLSPAAEEAWRSSPNAQRFEDLLARQRLAESNPYALALPARPPRNPRPGVWSTDDGLHFICTEPEQYEQYGDTYTEVIDRVEHVFKRVDAARWAYLRQRLGPAAEPIRQALVAVFGPARIATSEAA